MNHGNVCKDIKVQAIMAENPIAHMYDLQLLLQDRLGKAHNPEDSFVDIAQKVIYWRHCIHTECDELLAWFDEDCQDLDFQEVEMEVVDIMHFIFNIGIAIGLGSASLDRILKPYTSKHDSIVGLTLLGNNESYICNLSRKLTALIDQLPWKTWKTYDPHAVPELAHVMSAYADIIQAVLEIAAFNGMTMERVVSVYCAKNAENHRRQDNGY